MDLVTRMLRGFSIFCLIFFTGEGALRFFYWVGSRPPVLFNITIAVFAVVCVCLMSYVLGDR